MAEKSVCTLKIHSRSSPSLEQNYERAIGGLFGFSDLRIFASLKI